MATILNKLGLRYENIVLKHNRGKLKSRADADVSIMVGKVKLDSPVLCSNMPYLQRPNSRFLEIFNEKKWGYVYERLGGVDDILKFTVRINEENWHFKSISVGIQESDRKLLKSIINNKLSLDCLTIDVAFIYQPWALDFVKEVRQMFPDTYLIAGNFDSAAAAVELENIGVDCGKMGIGVSKNCSTLNRVGFGSCLISDLINIKERCPDFDIMSDGGVSFNDRGEKNIGDVFKSLNFGSKMVFSASLFQNVTELADSKGDIRCYGNSTARAKGTERHDEGFDFWIKTDGKSLERQMEYIIECLRSSCSYAGIKKIEDAEGSCDYQIVL